MNRTKLVLGAALITLFMTGCASNSKKLETNAMQDLTSKVDQLSNDVSAMRADVQAVKDDAARANHRLDNMGRNYKK